MAGAVVEARDITRRFHLGSEDVWALQGVSVSAHAGEVLALVGRSGSGKTTLLNIIAGLDRPTSGEVEIDGQRIDTMGEKELTQLRRHKLGFVFQSFGLLPLLSAHENVELPLRIAGFSHGDRVRRAKAALSMVGLGRRSHHRPYELSGGEQQRVAIARAMATEPTLLLADEPTGELDSATATAVFQLLRTVAREQGVTVITCTHDRLVMELADRIQELADGKLVVGAHGDVMQTIHAREQSPFAASGNGREQHIGAGAQGLSSLIGADSSIFVMPEPPKPSVSVAPAQEAAASKDESDEDNSRWAPRR